MTGPGAELDALVGRLAQRGVIPTTQGATVEVLSGGVSADVVVVASGTRRVVVKRALPRLRVAQKWVSSPSRVIIEAAALEAAHRIRPANVPAVLDLDEERLVLTLECAPPDSRNWKQELLNGAIDSVIGGWLGIALADWHTQSAADGELTARFAHHTHFFDLRISPFFLSTAEVHPDLAPQIHAVVERMNTRRVCLVHGDFSPKNVLFGRGWFWVVDWETAHTGDPTFDIAFLVSHLVIKAVHRPDLARGYRACAEAFLGGYHAHTGVEIDHDGLGRLVGCLLLARIDGKSPVDYLDEPERDRVRTLGRRVVQEGVVDLAELWPDAAPSEGLRG